MVCEFCNVTEEVLVVVVFASVEVVLFSVETTLSVVSVVMIISKPLNPSSGFFIEGLSFQTPKHTKIAAHSPETEYEI